MSNDIMTPEEFEALMKRIKARHEDTVDLECIHREMDAAMCDLLKKLGYTAGVKIFSETEKWYA